MNLSKSSENRTKYLRKYWPIAAITMVLVGCSGAMLSQDRKSENDFSREARETYSADTVRESISELYGSDLKIQSLERFNGLVLIYAHDSTGSPHYLTFVDPSTIVYGGMLDVQGKFMRTGDGKYRDIYTFEPIAPPSSETIAQASAISPVPTTSNATKLLATAKSDEMRTSKELVQEARELSKDYLSTQLQTAEIGGTDLSGTYRAVSNPRQYFEMGDKGPILYVFTDPSCSGCQQSHPVIDSYANAGKVTVRYLPVGVIRPNDSLTKSTLSMAQPNPTAQRNTFYEMLSPLYVSELIKPIHVGAKSKAEFSMVAQVLEQATEINTSLVAAGRLSDLEQELSKINEYHELTESQQALVVRFVKDAFSIVQTNNIALQSTGDAGTPKFLFQTASGPMATSMVTDASSVERMLTLITDMNN